MQRRKLLQSIGAGAVMAVGASASASAESTAPKTGGATHLSVVDEGTRRLIPLGLLKNGLGSLDVDPADSCVVDCCEDCYCSNCLCGNCSGGGGGGC